MDYAEKCRRLINYYFLRLKIIVCFPESPIEVTEEGIVICVNDEHSEKA